MKWSATLLATAMMLLLVGCRATTGIFRTVDVAQPPAPAVVVVALSSLPEAEHITQHEVPASTQWGLSTGTVHLPAFRQIFFEGQSGGGEVVTRPDAEGIQHLSLSFYVRGTPIQAKFERARALLDATYLRLRRSDPSLPPPQAVQETLVGYPYF